MQINLSPKTTPLIWPAFFVTLASLGADFYQVIHGISLSSNFFLLSPQNIFNRQPKFLLHEIMEASIIKPNKLSNNYNKTNHEHLLSTLPEDERQACHNGNIIQWKMAT